MRVLIDTNLLISFLLRPIAGGVPALILAAALAGAFALILPEEVVVELRRRVASKPYLRERIASEAVERLVTRLSEVAEVRPKLGGMLPAVSRDAKDDFLIAHAIAAGADYLVSGDKDLLVLGQVDGVRIVGPAAFLGLLDGGEPTP